MPETTTPQPLLSKAEVDAMEARANAASEWLPTEFEHDSDADDQRMWQWSWRIQGVCDFAEEGADEATALFIAHARTDIPALVRDWRAMKARIEALTTDWCQCGHLRDKHQFFSDHDECYECDQASPDLCCEWRPAPRPNENAALRERLAALRTRVAEFEKKEADAARAGNWGR